MFKPVLHKDTRYSSWYFDNRKVAAQIIKNYQAGKLKVIASCSDGTYTVKVLDNNAMLYFKKGVKEPVPSGNWMDWPEKHWNLAKPYKEYTHRERAKMEACEQLRYIKHEFEGAWLDTYAPKATGDYWHSGGSDLAMYRKTRPQYEQDISKMYKRIRSQKK